MSLDNALRYVFRNYSTLFLLVALIAVPLHLAYTFAYRDVVAVGDLHHFIAELPLARKVAGVGRGRLAESKTAWLGVTAIELALIPLFAGAARRTVEVDAAGGLPKVIDSLAHAWPGRKRGAPRAAGGLAERLAALAGGLVLGLAAGWLFRRIGLVLSELVGRERLWVVVGLAEGMARAVGAPLALVSLGCFARAPSPPESSWSSSVP